MSKSTVADIVKRFNKENRINFKEKSGLSRKLTYRDEKCILRKVKKHPRISAPKLQTQVLHELGKNVYEDTIRKI